MQDLKSFLIKHKYPEQIIDHGVGKVMSLNNNKLRSVKIRAEENIISYLSTHNPRDPEMFRVIVDNVQILNEDDKMRDILSRYKMIKSKRQPYNPKRLLSKAKFTANDKHEVRKCNRPNCGLCIHLVEGNSILFHACYTAEARRCETVEYALKKGRNSYNCLRVPALIGWSGPALKHSGT